MKKFKSLVKRAFARYAELHYQTYKSMYDAGISWM